MRTVAVCNLKGGVGKTTTTVNLGASLARTGKRVLLIDCDPQCSLTAWLRSEPHNGEATLYDILRGQSTVRSAATFTRWPNLSVVRASPKLTEIDRGALAGERVLWARMSEDYDYVLMDCSASPGVVLSNAMTAAEEIIVPVQAKGMARPSIERLGKLIGEIDERGSNGIALTGILVCLFDGRTRISRAVLGELRAKYSGLVFDTIVHENVKLAEAADRRRPITEYAPDSRGAAEYAAVASELAARDTRAVAVPAASAVGAPSQAAATATPPFPVPQTGSAIGIGQNTPRHGNPAHTASAYARTAAPSATSALRSLPRGTLLGQD